MTRAYLFVSLLCAYVKKSLMNLGFDIMDFSIFQEKCFIINSRCLEIYLSVCEK